MNQSAAWISNDESGRLEAEPSKRLSFLKFLMRYPFFLLAFGPPIFRPHSTFAGVDTSQSHFDFWSIFQVGWLFAIALRAMLRLGFSQRVLIPAWTRSILKYPLFLGLLFTVSIAYSPGRALSAEFSILYFLTWVCVVEFLVDAYQNPPNWIQALIALRTIMSFLLGIVLICFFIQPALVMKVVEGAGIRLGGGAVYPITLIGPIIAIISAYTFLSSLEPRSRSVLFFIAGLISTLVTQARGAEIALFFALSTLAFGWAKTGKRIAYIFIAASMALVLLTGAVVGTVGGGRIWERFNRGQDLQGILTLSGRTEMWASVVDYTITHPQGMGYMAGMRTFHGGAFASNLHTALNSVGGTDSSYMEVLADAGWLAIAFYMITILKTASFGLRFAKKPLSKSSPRELAARHALRCALLLLFYFLVNGVEDTGFCNPLRPEFYMQNITLAIIIGISASLSIASRAHSAYAPE